MKTIAKRIIGALGTGALIAGIIIGANAHDKKEEIKVVEKKQTFHDKFIKQLAGNTPNSGQFDEDI